MNQQSPVTEQLPNISRINHLEDVLAYMDMLHNAASDEQTRKEHDMDSAEMTSVLKDIIYTAQETLAEIETHRARNRHAQPMLRILPKVDKAG